MALEPLIIEQCRPDHVDSRRELYTAFNTAPYFRTSQAGIISANEYSDITDLVADDGSQNILYLLKGTGTIINGEKHRELAQHTRVIANHGSQYTFLLDAGSSLLYCLSSQREMPVPRQNFVNRIIFQGNFEAKQAKIMYIKEDCLLGGDGFGHYHDYKELYTILNGEAEFLFEDMYTKERSKKKVTNTNGLIIPKNTPHIAKAGKGTVLIGFTEEIFISREHNEKPYLLHWD